MAGTHLHALVILATELQQALVNGDWTRKSLKRVYCYCPHAKIAFDLDTVKLLMSMFDTDRSGTIGTYRVTSQLGIALLIVTNRIQRIPGTLEIHQGLTALERSKAKNSTLPSLNSGSTSAHNSWVSWRGIFSPEKKSASEPAAPQGHGGYGFRPPQPTGITFDRFVRCCVVVRQLTESFQR
ncbi:2806_t:CDS:2 [Acaulospora colombiana]|uniref:2806_t:CDS:1 n=1 Tax=Acaulospora colombiana TaxID=27376 RepID=A0ACA9N7T9_9GLOM|nr:2806_t:CDS:2 [Acaulospora colombiana]